MTIRVSTAAAITIMLATATGLLAAGLVSAHPTRESLITGQSIGRVALGATTATIAQSYPGHQILHVEIPLEGEAKSPAVQIRRDAELLITVEVSDAGLAWRITTEHPRFRTQRGMGVGSTFGALIRAYGQPISLDLPEGAVFVAYRIAGGRIGFQLDRGFDEVLQEHLPPRDAVVVRVVVR